MKCLNNYLFFLYGDIYIIYSFDGHFTILNDLRMVKMFFEKLNSLWFKHNYLRKKKLN